MIRYLFLKTSSVWTLLCSSGQSRRRWHRDAPGSPSPGAGAGRNGLRCGLPSPAVSRILRSLSAAISLRGRRSAIPFARRPEPPRAQQGCARVCSPGTRQRLFAQDAAPKVLSHDGNSLLPLQGGFLEAAAQRRGHVETLYIKLVFVKNVLCYFSQ